MTVPPTKSAIHLENLKAGRWDEGEARAYLRLVLFTAQRLRSIDREEYPVFVRLEERLNDGYLFNKDERGGSRSLLLEATSRALDKATVLPEDLVNILAMLRREERMIPFMGSLAGSQNFDDVRLEPHLEWLRHSRTRPGPR
ncbi:hypothetical protein BH24DEI2_BH24DEI2_07630 [soil metagenome]